MLTPENFVAEAITDYLSRSKAAAHCECKSALVSGPESPAASSIRELIW
jgi:hypothetical protein